jgi:hypothetical protein
VSWWFLLLACPRPAPPRGSDDAPSAPPAGTVTAREVVGPERVVQAGAPHLCVDVPAGWEGITSAGATFLTLSHPDGYRYAVSVDVGDGFSVERPGHHPLFEDAGTYRSPLLPDAGTRSWASDDPLGTYLRAWYGTVRGVPVEILLEYPHGRVTAGERVFEPFSRWCTP